MTDTSGVGFELRGTERGRRHRSAARALLIAALLAGLVVPATAQVAPNASFHASMGTGTTGDPNVSPTGG